jgi:hypothetical protein
MRRTRPAHRWFSGVLDIGLLDDFLNGQRPLDKTGDLHLRGRLPTSGA